MTIYQLNPDSTTQKTSIMYALSRGYTFKLAEDGVAEVTSPKGDVYHVDNFRCDCPDSLGRDGGSFDLPNGRKMCKHSIWVAQLTPCPDCDGYAMLRMDNWKHFGCCTPGCRHLIAFQTVKAKRQQAYRQQEQEADALKTHQPANPEEIIAKAEEASAAIFPDSHQPEPETKTFNSRFGVSVAPFGDKWKVTVCGFSDSTHPTEQQAIERAERLEILEASHADKRTRINVA